MSCASDAIANAALLVPLPHFIPAVSAYHSSSGVANSAGVRADWLYKCLCETQSVVFLNTDEICTSNTTATAQSSSERNFLQENAVEVRLIEMITRAFQLSGYDMTEVGIISPYRNQVRKINESLLRLNAVISEQTVRSKAVCEVSTVDKYQGRDMDVIIFSSVKCQNDAAVSYCNQLDLCASYFIIGW